MSWSRVILSFPRSINCNRKFLFRILDVRYTVLSYGPCVGIGNVLICHRTAISRVIEPGTVIWSAGAHWRCLKIGVYLFPCLTALERCRAHPGGPVRHPNVLYALCIFFCNPEGVVVFFAISNGNLSGQIQATVLPLEFLLIASFLDFP